MGESGLLGVFSDSDHKSTNKHISGQINRKQQKKRAETGEGGGEVHTNRLPSGVRSSGSALLEDNCWRGANPRSKKKVVNPPLLDGGGGEGVLGLRKALVWPENGQLAGGYCQIAAELDPRGEGGRGGGVALENLKMRVRVKAIRSCPKASHANGGKRVLRRASVFFFALQEGTHTLQRLLD